MVLGCRVPGFQPYSHADKMYTYVYIYIYIYKHIYMYICI